MIASYFGWVMDYYPAIWHWYVHCMGAADDGYKGNGLVVSLTVGFAIVAFVSVAGSLVEGDPEFLLIPVVPLLIIALIPWVPLAAALALVLWAIAATIRMMRRKAVRKWLIAESRFKELQEISERATNQHADMMKAYMSVMEEGDTDAQKLLESGVYGRYQPAELDWKSIGVE